MRTVPETWVRLVLENVDDVAALSVYGRPSNRSSASELIWSRPVDPSDFDEINAIDDDDDDDAARRRLLAIDEASRDMATEAWEAAQRHCSNTRGDAWTYQLQVLLDDQTRAGADGRFIKVPAIPESEDHTGASEARVWAGMVKEMFKMMMQMLRSLPDVTTGHIRSLDAITEAQQRLTTMQTKMLEELFATHRSRLEQEIPRGPLIEIDPETADRLMMFLVPLGLIFAANQGIDLAPILEQVGFDTSNMKSTVTTSATVPPDQLKKTLTSLRDSIDDEQVASFKAAAPADIVDDLISVLDLAKNEETSADDLRASLRQLEGRITPFLGALSGLLRPEQIALLMQARQQ